MFFIDSYKILIRHFCLNDLFDVYEFCKDPDVGPRAGWKAHQNIEETKSVLINMINSKDSFAIVDKKTNKVIGSIGLYKDNKREDPNCRMIGYVLNRSYWGKGIMKEAVLSLINYVFKNTSIMILSIYHFPNNFQSKRVIEKCGFLYEGNIRRASRLYNGAIVDNISYSLTREEFLRWENKDIHQ